MSAEISDNKPNTDLIFAFEAPFVPSLFHDDSTHGMHDRMKKVDFLVTSPQLTWMIEVKDPDNRKIPPHQRSRQNADFHNKLASGRLFSEELIPKLNDTLIYLVLQNRAPAGEIRYIVFIGLDSLDAAALVGLQDDLRRQMAKLFPGPFKGDWNSQFDVIVLNLAEWNAQMLPHSVRRP